jgi:hypothetical protein
MIDKDEEYYREFTLNSKKFDDFYQDDGQEDFLMLLGASFQNNISHNIRTKGVSWNGDWHISISTNKIDEISECEEFFKYLTDNKILDGLIDHYVEFYRRSASKRFDEVCVEYKSIKKAQNDYKELNRELPQNGIREVSNKKKNKL